MIEITKWVLDNFSVYLLVGIAYVVGYNIGKRETISFYKNALDRLKEELRKLAKTIEEKAQK